MHFSNEHPHPNGRCYNTDCWHQIGKAGKKYTSRYECLAIMEARPTPKYPTRSPSSVTQKKNEQIYKGFYAKDRRARLKDPAELRHPYVPTKRGRQPLTARQLILSIPLQEPPSLEIIHLCVLGALQLQGGTWLWLVWMLYSSLVILFKPTSTDRPCCSKHTQKQRKKEEKKSHPMFSLHSKFYYTERYQHLC